MRRCLPILLLMTLLSACHASAQNLTPGIPSRETDAEDAKPSTNASAVYHPAEYAWPNTSSISAEDPNIAIEVILFERETCLRMDITAHGFEWPASSVENRMVRGIEFHDADTNARLLLEEVGRGGGGGGEGLEAQTVETYLYDVQATAMPDAYTMIIIFDDIFGISRPACFTLKPIRRPNMQCPQLAATTPEG
jgi:hypothetical protein